MSNSAHIGSVSAHGPSWPCNVAIGLLACVTVTAALVEPRSVGFDAPFTAVLVHQPGQLAAVVVRVGMLLSAFVAAPRVRTEALLALAFVASLAWRGLFVAFVLGALIVMGLGARRVTGDVARRRLVLATALSAAVVVACVLVHPSPSMPRLPRNLTEEAAFYVERGNFVRAEFAASRWCDRETIPGKGCLLLGRMLLQTDDRARAREALRRLLDPRCAPEDRRQAERLLARVNSGQ